MLVWIKTIVSGFHGSVFKKTKRHGPPLRSSGLKQIFQGFMAVFSKRQKDMGLQDAHLD